MCSIVSLEKLRSAKKLIITWNSLIHSASLARQGALLPNLEPLGNRTVAAEVVVVGAVAAEVADAEVVVAAAVVAAK